MPNVKITLSPFELHGVQVDNGEPTNGVGDYSATVPLSNGPHRVRFQGNGRKNGEFTIEIAGGTPSSRSGNFDSDGFVAGSLRFGVGAAPGVALMALSLTANKRSRKKQKSGTTKAATKKTSAKAIGTGKKPVSAKKRAKTTHPRDAAKKRSGRAKK